MFTPSDFILVEIYEDYFSIGKEEEDKNQTNGKSNKWEIK